MRLIKNIIKLKESYEEDDNYIDEDYEEEDADDWLKGYINNPTNPNPENYIIDDLLELYPVDSDMKLYRGLHFSNKEQWENFKNNISESKVLDLSNKVTSFTTKFTVALNFATTKPVYLSQVTSKVRRDIIDIEKSKSVTGERYGGYKGIIIGIKVPKEDIINVNKSPFSAENEYLVLKGSYEIIYFKPILKYGDIVDNPKFNIDNFLKKINFENLNSSKILNYLLKNNYAISDEAKHNLFNKLINEIDFNSVTTKLYKPEIYIGINSDEIEKILILYDFRILSIINYSYLWTSSDYEILKNKVNGLLEKIYNLLEKDYTYLENIKYEAIKPLLIDKSMSAYSKIKSLLGKRLSYIYNKLNSRKEMNRINKLSKKDQEEEIKKLKDAIIEESNNYQVFLNY
jgi:hypothetical protein